jgi:hypothetical protein
MELEKKLKFIKLEKINQLFSILYIRSQWELEFEIYLLYKTQDFFLNGIMSQIIRPPIRL